MYAYTHARAYLPDAVDLAGDDEGEDLFAGPERSRLDNGRHRHVSVPPRQLHQQVHHVRLFDEDVAFRHLTDGAEGVLHDT